MSIRDGVTQAMFPEGGLSLTGAVGPAKMGLLDYIVRDFSPDAGADVVFVPVALNYDRVLEDRVLMKAHETGTRRFKVRPMQALGWIARMSWNRLWGRAAGFGHAAVCYGDPVSLRDFATAHPQSTTEQLAEVLMQRIREAVPILPVALAAAALVQAPAGADRAALRLVARQLAEQAGKRGAFLLMPVDAAESMFDEGLAQLVLRGIVLHQDEQVTVPEAQRQALAFYAASALQRLSEGDEGQGGARLLGPPEGRGNPQGHKITNGA